MQNASEDVALDELFLFARGGTEGGGGEAVGVAQRTSCGFVKHGEGVDGEDVFGGADASEAGAQIIGGIVGGERADAKAMMES